MPNKLGTKTEGKVCESCGREFGCGAKLDGCWCTEMKLTESQSADIKSKFGDCLCPRCLEKIAVEKA